MKSLTTYLNDRKLISVRRQDIDDHVIQGFVVGISSELVALEYVYDFQIDGLMVLRRSDISEIKRTGTDEFQETLLKREGIQPGSQGPIPSDLISWRSVIQELSAQYPLMILERELGPSPRFAIGRPTAISQAQVEFLTFSGTARWSEKANRFKYSQISSLQVNTRYVNFYDRHFRRGAA